MCVGPSDQFTVVWRVTSICRHLCNMSTGYSRSTCWRESVTQSTTSYSSFAVFDQGRIYSHN